MQELYIIILIIVVEDRIENTNRLKNEGMTNKKYRTEKCTEIENWGPSGKMKK